MKGIFWFTSRMIGNIIRWKVFVKRSKVFQVNARLRTALCKGKTFTVCLWDVCRFVAMVTRFLLLLMSSGWWFEQILNVTKPSCTLIFSQVSSVLILHPHSNGTAAAATTVEKMTLLYARSMTWMRMAEPTNERNKINFVYRYLASAALCILLLLLI